MDQMLTVCDVERFLRVHRATIYRLIRRGDLTAHRTGRDFRFRPEDIEIYLHRASTNHFGNDPERPGAAIVKAGEGCK